MLCSACGAENPDKAAFCGQCGAQLPPRPVPGVPAPVGEERKDFPPAEPGSQAPDLPLVEETENVPSEMARPSDEPVAPPAPPAQIVEAIAPSAEPLPPALAPEPEEMRVQAEEPAPFPGAGPEPTEEPAFSPGLAPGPEAVETPNQAAHTGDSRAEPAEAARAEEEPTLWAGSTGAEREAVNLPKEAPSAGPSVPLVPGPAGPVPERGELRPIHCPVCGAELLADAAFCGLCGATAARPLPGSAPPAPEQARCPTCGADLKPSAAFCGRCGAAAARLSPAPAPPTPVQAHCRACGAQVSAAAAFCGRCGAAVVPAASSSPPPVSIPPLRVRCPACGGEVSASATFCGLCGAALVGPGRPAARTPLAGMLTAPTDAGLGEQPKARRRRRGCRRTGCLVVGILAVIVLGIAGWFAGLHTGTWERIGFYRPPEARLLGGRPNEAAAEALKAEMVAAGFSDAGLQVAVLPVKGKDYNLAVAVLDASQGFRAPGSVDLMIECLQHLAAGETASEYHIGRAAAHCRDGEGNKIFSLTATASDIRALASGQMSRTDFLRAAEGSVQWEMPLGGEP